MRGDPTLTQLDAYGLYWLVWSGRATGRYWAMPQWDGAPDRLIEASDVGELDDKMTAIERAYPQR